MIWWPIDERVKVYFNIRRKASFNPPWLDNFCPDILRGCRVSWNWYKLVSRLKWFYSGPPNWSHLAHYRRLTRVLCKCFSSVLRIASSLESNVSIERQFVYTDTLARVVQFLFFVMNQSGERDSFVNETKRRIIDIFITRCIFELNYFTSSNSKDLRRKIVLKFFRPLEAI